MHQTPNPRPTSHNVAFEAFRSLQHAHYAAYARAHLGPQAADSAVRDTFTTILSAWKDILSDPVPTQRAWEHLRLAVHSHSGPPAPADHDDVHTLLALGYSTRASATLTGLPLGKVNYLARGARPSEC